MISRRSFFTSISALLVGGRALHAATQGSPGGDPEAPADRLSIPEAVQSRPAVVEGDNNGIIQTVEHKLKCTCGCNLDIFTCRTTDFTCTVSPALHRQVVALHENGATPDQIIDAFVTEYGEEILMAPPPEGFNLAGYLVPGLAITAAGTLLAAILMRRQAAAPVPAPVLTGAANVSAEDQARLERALSEVVD